MNISPWRGDGTVKMRMGIKKAWPIVAIIVSTVGFVFLRFGPVLFSRAQHGANPQIIGADLAAADLGYLRHQAQRVDTLLKKEEIYQQRLAASREALADWERSFWSGSPEQATVEMVAVVEKLAAEAGLVISNKALHPSLRGPAKDGWQRIGVTLEGRTGYPELIRFYNKLLGSAKALFVEAIELRLDEYTSTLRFRIRLYSYTR